MSAQTLLTELQNLINAILQDDAEINSVNTTAHRSLLQKNIDAIQAHLDDQEMHGSGGLPVAAVGSILAYLGEAWGGIAPGTAGQGLLNELQGENYMPVWRDLIPHINLAYENDGYCYTGVEINTGADAYISGKNIRVYIPQLSKYVYLAIDDSKTFKLNLTVNTVGGFSNIYAVINKAALLAAANGSKVEISLVDEIAATHIVLLENKTGSGTTAARTSGMLQSLSEQYRQMNISFEKITLAANVATLNLTKYDKLGGRFFVETDANVTIESSDSYLLAEGEILVRNSGVSPITVTFNDIFYYKQIEIEAGGKRLYKYLRETSNSSRLSIFPVYSSETVKGVDISFAASPTFDLSKAPIQEMPVTGNTAPAISNEKPGGTYILTFAIDSTGGYSITPDSSFGTKTDNSIDAISSATANAIYIYTIVVRPNGSKFYTIESIGA